MSLRIGLGYDVHAFIKGRELVIGGEKIPHSMGLDGHSDADVLLHAICDALLGALAMGDIGKHFPDSDNEYKNIDSKVLLKRTFRLITDESYRLVNLDAVLIMEKPKVQAFIPAMRKNIAEILNCEINQVSVKATTTEKLGFTGREEGVAAEVVILLKKN